MGKLAKGMLTGVFLLISVVFIIVGFSLIGREKKFEEKGIKTEAVIVDIQKNRVKKRKANGYRYKYEHEVYVEYSVNGIEYTEELGSYNSKMKVGDEIDIYYLEDDPTDIQSKGSAKFLSILFIGLGSVFGIVAILILILGRNKV